MKTRSIRVQLWIHFVASAARKIELAGIAPVPIADNKEEKSGNVSRRNDGTEVHKTSSKSRRQRREIKRTDVSLSPVILSASNVFRSHVLSSLFPASSPLTAQDAPRPG